MDKGIDLFDRLILYCRKFERWDLVLLMVITDHITGAFYSLYFTANNSVDDLKMSILGKMLLICIMVPVIETLVFQTIVISVMVKYTKSRWFAVLISAIFFGLAHSYSTAYMAKAFVTGLFYGLLYIVCKKHYASFHLVAIHSLYNFMGLVIYEIIPRLKIA